MRRRAIDRNVEGEKRSGMSLVFSRQKTLGEKVESIFFSAGIQALILFRLSHFAARYRILRGLRIPTILYRLNQLLCHVDIDPDATIGRNVLLPHPFGIVIGATACIGNGVTIMQNVTIGSKSPGDSGKRHPTIEDGVFIGPQAVILGNICIKRNSRVGAGSIVLADVNENETIIGIHK
jgi:serine O-acetyltransferase